MMEYNSCKDCLFGRRIDLLICIYKYVFIFLNMNCLKFRYIVIEVFCIFF